MIHSCYVTGSELPLPDTEAELRSIVQRHWPTTRVARRAIARLQEMGVEIPQNQPSLEEVIQSLHQREEEGSHCISRKVSEEDETGEGKSTKKKSY